MPWLIVILGYLLGSIPTAYLAGRLLKGKDIRQMGDENVGTANAFRQLGAKTGLGVFFIDAGKGALAIAITQAANISQVWVLLAGAAAVIGHNWPVFLGFRGGRGLSTTAGVLYVLLPQPMLLITVPTLTALVIMRGVSRATIVAVILFLPVCWWLGVPWGLILYSISLLCLVGFTHFIRVKLPYRISG